ncbi:MAG: hypothetical protein ACK5TH_26010, partial [Prosthecobacter sp.]
ALLNVLKTLDLPQAVAAAASRTRVVLYTKDKAPLGMARHPLEKPRPGKTTPAPRPRPSPEAVRR